MTNTTFTHLVRCLSLRFALLLSLVCFVCNPAANAAKRIVNLYTWSGYIPDAVIQQFEKETGIKVNFATYENNEIMYAKLRTSKTANYDIIMPSSNYIDRMRRENRLEKLDFTLLPNSKHLNPDFLHLPFDPQAEYSVPYLWGTTGMFVNDKFYKTNSVKRWSDLWNERFRDQLLILDDSRDIFAISLISLGYSINDRNPEHIKQAYEKLRSLMANIKVFSTDTVVSIIIDEDARAGIAWNGDAYKASQENPAIHYNYPEEGFVIWIENLAMPKNPPHKTEAYEFINFLLRPEIAKTIALYTGYPTVNLAAQQLLPQEIRSNPTVYPKKETLRRGQYQLDVGSETLSLYEKYWEELKMMG